MASPRGGGVECAIGWLPSCVLTPLPAPGAEAMEPGLRETDRWVQPGAAIAAGKWSEEPVLAVGKALANRDAKPDGCL